MGPIEHRDYSWISVTNDERSCVAVADSRLVMAEQSTRDVVNQARSVGDPSPSDVSALTPNDSNADGDLERTTALANNRETSSSESDKYRDVGVADIHPRLNGSESGDVVPEIGNGKETVSLDGAPMLLFLLTVAQLDDNLVNQVGGTIIENREHLSETVEEGGEIGTTDDLPVLQTSAEVSGGSDTDTSRADVSELSEKAPKEGNHHGRSNSVKKPISFKAVSVTKSFLAKATAGSAPAAKGSSDKGTVST